MTRLVRWLCAWALIGDHGQHDTRRWHDPDGGVDA